jgi:AsmA protein
MKKVLLIAAAAVAAIVVLGAIGLWLFFDVDQLRPRLESAMGGALGRKVSLGHIRLALFAGSLAIDDVAIGEDPAFGTEPFVTAKGVSVGVEMMPLITSRALHIDSFKLDQPKVTLLRAANGTWNFSGLSAAASGSAAKPAAPAATSGSSAAGGSADVSIKTITIADGQVRIGTTAKGDKVRVYDHVNVECTDVSQTSKIPFTMTATTPGGGTLDLRGDAGPLNPADAAATPLHATADVQKIDVATTGFIDPASGLAGTVGFKGAVDSDGKVMTSKGTVTAAQMRFMPGAAASAVPFAVDYETDYTPATQHGAIKRGDLHVGKATAHLTGTYDLSGATPQVRLKLAGQQLAATELQAALPALGITLPPGSSLKEGTIDTDLAIAGPVDKVLVTGPLSLANAKISGFDLISQMSAIGALAGLPKSGDTSIQALSAAVKVAAQGNQIDNLNLVVPAIGSLTGNGTISPKGAMDFAMMAKLSSANVPFTVHGTTSHPTFAPDVSRAVKSALTDPGMQKKAADAIGGLFRKKK